MNNYSNYFNFNKIKPAAGLCLFYFICNKFLKYLIQVNKSVRNNQQNNIVIKMKQYINTIALFKGLQSTQIKKISEIAITKKARKNELLFSSGEKAEGFYGITMGKVKVYRSSPSGKEQIIHIFGPGHVFGEVPVFQGGSYPANAMAMESSELFYFGRNDFRRIIEEDPDLAMNMLAVLSKRLRLLVNQVAALSLSEVPGRLAAYLLLLKSSQQQDELQLELPKGQIAAYLGTIQETLSRVLKKMSEQEIISVNGRAITIIDEETLKNIANGNEQL
jgi:CRP/FNR family transcriptional regulator